MRGKMEDGSWRTPFDPVKSQHRKDDYCEGNAWQYTWLVPLDVEGLIELFGGDQPFTTKLDALFEVEEDISGGSSDITGLIGMYIQSATLNGKPYTRSFITYRNIMAGGTLTFTMGAEPNMDYAAKPEDRPQSIIYR